MDIRLIAKYYWPHVKKYKKSGILIFVMYGCGVVFTSIVNPLLYKRIIDIVTNTSDPLLVGGTLMSTLFLLGGAIFVLNIFYRGGDFAMVYAQSRILKDIADDAFVRLQQHSYEFFANTFSGALVARVKRYVNAFEIIQDQVVFTVWMSGFRLLFSFVVLMFLSPLLAGIFLAWIITYAGLTALFVKKKIRKDLLTTAANSRMTGALADALTNILNIKMFSGDKKEAEIFAEATLDERLKRSDGWFFQNTQFAFQGYFIGLFEFVAMYAAITLWTKGQISVGTIILMQIYIFASFDIVWNISKNFTRTMYAFAEAKEMVDIFEQPLSVADPVEPLVCAIKAGQIQISNISFSYGDNNPVFENFSLEIQPGEKVGLVGRSGAGKTTITKLILRFVDIQQGQIIIDGQDISQLPQNDLRSQISYVPQDAILFHRTLRENIAYAREGATDREVEEAAHAAHADEFIKKLPKGYDTLVGERGIKLSGGERQRVAIARVMLKDAPILILDEATSSLDSVSEKYIQDSLSRIMEGRTTLVVAHRLSTLQKMDRIVVLENGKILEQGTHKELLATKGLYYDLWKHQSQGFVD